MDLMVDPESHLIHNNKSDRERGKKKSKKVKNKYFPTVNKCEGWDLFKIKIIVIYQVLKEKQKGKLLA